MTDFHSSKNKTVAVVYHANCIDGFTAAWVAYEYYKPASANGDVTLMPHSYGDDFAPVIQLAEEHDMVVIVDYSFKLEELKMLANKAEVLVLDHHRTAFINLAAAVPEELINEQYIGLYDDLRIVLDNNVSGALLTWYYLHESPPSEAPDLIHYVSDYDLWKFELAETKAVNMVLRTTPKEPRAWSKVAIELKYSMDHVLAAGDGMLLLQEQIAQELAAHAMPVHIGAEDYLIGHGVPAPYSFASRVGHLLAEASGTFGATWVRRGNVYDVSLRSDGDFDVCALATSMGGGGHKTAAGFRLPIADMECLPTFYIMYPSY